jgi:hypothetical protein
MKRYLVFCYDGYYPSGGRNDFIGSFDVFEDAIKAGKLFTSEYIDILDTEKTDDIYYEIIYKDSFSKVIAKEGWTSECILIKREY